MRSDFLFSSRNRWNFVKNTDNKKVDELAKETKTPKLVISILFNRGFDTVDKINQFLNPKLEMLADPFLLHDMEKGCERIKKAIMLGEKITVYGDYDADGLTSTSIMYEALLQLGADVRYYIPDRFKDGYGPNVEVYKQLINQGTSLIVTVDNGVSGLKAVKYAQEQGVDVVITDHHEMPAELPNAYAIIHPRHPDGDYPFGELSGAGVAFKTASALLEEIPSEMLDLAAIGTVADIVSLTDENRVIVSAGLKVLQNTERIGLLSLYQEAGIDQEKITAETIGFGIAPRLNALGRMENGSPGVELLTTFDEQRAKEIASHIQQLNVQRQELVNQITTEALKMVEKQGQDHAVNLIVGQNWHEGVLGIVASRIVEATGKPTLVLNADETTGAAKGSGRSIEAFNLFSALDGHRDQLLSFGGHHMACGLTISTEKRSEVQAILDTEAGKQDISSAPQPTLDIAGQIDLTNFDLSDLDTIEMLAPFGQDNEKPLFAFNNYKIKTAKPMGKGNNHLRLTLETTKGDLISAVFFGIAQDKLAQILQDPAEVEFVGYPDKNVWQNKTSLQIKIDDLKLEQKQVNQQEPGAKLKVFDQRVSKLTVDLFKRPGVYAFFEKNILSQVKKYLPTDAKAVILPVQEQEIQTTDLFLIDCPKDLRDLQTSLNKVDAERIHLVFYHKNDVYQHGMPDRKQFGNLYRFVLSHQDLNISRDGEQIAKHLGLTKELMIFMFQVFFEVGFVKIENGLVTGVPGTQRVNLQETSSYHSRRLQIRTQQILLHSKSADLIKWVKEQSI